MAYYNGKKVMAVVDYKPAILIEKEITKVRRDKWLTMLETTTTI